MTFLVLDIFFTVPVVWDIFHFKACSVTKTFFLYFICRYNSLVWRMFNCSLYLPSSMNIEIMGNRDSEWWSKFSSSKKWLWGLWVTSTFTVKRNTNVGTRLLRDIAHIRRDKIQNDKTILWLLCQKCLLLLISALIV